ncbi:hypothetical protein LXL04_002252 [Taraxacum kok-saghyz]
MSLLKISIGFMILTVKKSAGFREVLCGKLCVMLSDDEYEVWVMDEYGVAESWVKYRVCSQFADDYAYAIGCTSHNVEGHLCLYDPIANTETMFRNFCVIEEGATRIVEYVDSLVWVTPDDREKIEMERCQA